MPEYEPVIIIEDDPNTATIAKACLEEAGLANPIIIARTGECALHHLSGGVKPCLVLIDIRLPDWHGIALTKHIKQRYPWLPVGIVTGSTNQEDMIAARDAGARVYMVKPMRPEDLAAAVALAREHRIIWARRTPIAPG